GATLNADRLNCKGGFWWRYRPNGIGYLLPKGTPIPDIPLIPMTLLKIRRLTMLTVFVSSSLAFSQTTPLDPDAAEDEVILTQPWFGYEWIVPEFEDISVHDPSIVVADGQFYVFGSHLSA